VLEDPSEFDRGKHEIDIVEKVLLANYNEIFINGNFYDVEEDKVSLSMVDLLKEAKKLPEVVVFLKVNEKNFLSRVFNRREVEDEYNALMEKRKKEKQLEREQARELAIQNGEEIPEDDGQLPVEEDDPDAPKLDEMIQEKEKKLKEQREADNEKIEEMKNKFEEEKIPLIMIECDRDIENVFKNICHELKPFLEKRDNIIEKEIPSIIDEDKLEFYEKCYTVKRSRYGFNNSIDPSIFWIKKSFPMIYEDRIYFFENESMRSKAKEEPLKWLKTSTIPIDINYKPKVFLIGKAKSGKSSLAKMYLYFL
jgi:adenylate/nucleoside-diphosphate kinase